MPYFSHNRQWLVLVLLFAGSMLVQAQYRLQLGAGVADIGFLVGGESVYVGYELHSLEHNIPSFSYSIAASRVFREEKSFQPVLELQYSRAGLNYSQSFLFDQIKYKVKIHYLTVPLLLRMNLRSKKERSAGIELGPYASYRVSAVRDLTMYGEKERRKVDNITPLDAGLILGSNFGVLRKPIHLDAGFRISYSLVNMMTPLDGSIRIYYGPEKEYARNITIMFTVSTSLNKE